MTVMLDAEQLPANRKEITFEWLLRKLIELHPKIQAADYNALWMRIRHQSLTQRAWGFIQCNYRTSDEDLLLEYFRLFSKENLDYKEAEDGLRYHRTVVFKETPLRGVSKPKAAIRQSKGVVSRRVDQRRAMNFALNPHAA